MICSLYFSYAELNVRMLRSELEIVVDIKIRDHLVVVVGDPALLPTDLKKGEGPDGLWGRPECHVLLSFQY
jgi:hypothetical protein